ncbi:MAG: cell division protein ZapA [candidate division Zixibacteria bacterium]
MEKAKVKVTIFGREYSIVSEVDPDYINKAADFLDSRMREVAENFPNASENRVAVLAALNITDELFRSDTNNPEESDSEKVVIRLTQKLSEIL